MLSRIPPVRNHNPDTNAGGSGSKAATAVCRADDAVRLTAVVLKLENPANASTKLAFLGAGWPTPQSQVSGAGVATAKSGNHGIGLGADPNGLQAVGDRQRKGTAVEIEPAVRFVTDLQKIGSTRKFGPQSKCHAGRLTLEDGAPRMVFRPGVALMFTEAIEPAPRSPDAQRGFITFAAPPKDGTPLQPDT